MRTEEQIQDVALTATPKLSDLSDDQLAQMAEAGAEVVNIHRLLTKTGANIVGELLKTQEQFFEWDHLPKGDVYDRETHGQYYYHAHATNKRFDGEHGHFHTFLRPKGMPAGARPADVPGAKMPEKIDDKLSHLVSISMDPKGFPFRLFTVNRWVTGEVWYPADEVIRMLDIFEIDHTWPSWPVNRWVTAMFPLFKPQIEALVRMRDETVARWAAERQESATPLEEVFEDREREVTSFLDVNTERQIAAIQKEIGRRGG